MRVVAEVEAGDVTLVVGKKTFSMGEKLIAKTSGKYVAGTTVEVDECVGAMVAGFPAIHWLNRMAKMDASLPDGGALVLSLMRSRVKKHTKLLKMILSFSSDDDVPRLLCAAQELGYDEGVQYLTSFLISSFMDLDMNALASMMQVWNIARDKPTSAPNNVFGDIVATPYDENAIAELAALVDRVNIFVDHVRVD